MTVTWALRAGWVGLMTASASGAISQATVQSPGGFLQVGAYRQTCGCSLNPGDDMISALGAGAESHEATFTPTSGLALTASSVDAAGSNDANGWAGMGYFRMSGSNRGPVSMPFAQGVANGGWKDTLTVNHPSYSGQAGYLLFNVRVRGTMRAVGISGSVSIAVRAYKDNLSIATNPWFSFGGADTSGGAWQAAGWSLATYAYSEDVSRPIDGTVTFAVPITFGQSCTVGVYAAGVAGMRSSGSYPYPIHSILDFSSQGVEWAGIVGVRAGGAEVTGYTVVSGSGIDWSGPLGACDPDMNQDGNADQDDVSYLVNVIAGGGNPSGIDPDFNRDGNVDQDDTSALVNVIAGGACP